MPHKQAGCCDGRRLMVQQASLLFVKIFLKYTEENQVAAKLMFTVWWLSRFAPIIITDGCIIKKEMQEVAWELLISTVSLKFVLYFNYRNC